MGTIVFIHSRNASAADSYNLYDLKKSKYFTSVQTAEKIPREVRCGPHVVGVFNGHAGIFVDPSHRAISIA